MRGVVAAIVLHVAILAMCCLAADCTVKEQLAKVKIGHRISVEVSGPPILMHLDQLDPGTEIRQIVLLTGCRGPISENSFTLTGCQKKRGVEQNSTGRVIRFEDIVSIEDR